MRRVDKSRRSLARETSTDVGTFYFVKTKYRVSRQDKSRCGRQARAYHCLTKEIISCVSRERGDRQATPGVACSRSTAVGADVAQANLQLLVARSFACSARCSASALCFRPPACGTSLPRFGSIVVGHRTRQRMDAIAGLSR
jgi:hypothetical protein